jgi:hypothetical protein
MTGYKGRFGKESALEFFKRDDWYEQMFIAHGGMDKTVQMHRTGR